MDKQEPDIRCMQLPLANAWLLLPNAAVAEVIAYFDPESIHSNASIDGYLGHILWRGISVPLLSIEAISGLEAQEASAKDRIAIIYHPEGDESNPYLGLKLTSIPKAYKAIEKSVVQDEMDSGLNGLKYKIIINDEPVYIPDLDHLFSHIAE